LILILTRMNVMIDRVLIRSPFLQLLVFSSKTKVLLQTTL